MYSRIFESFSRCHSEASNPLDLRLFLCFVNFLRQKSPNRIFRRRLLSLLSHLFCKFHAGYCRFIALSVSESQQNVPKSALTKALKFASVKPFLHPQMTKVWQKVWQKIERQKPSKPARRKAFSDSLKGKKIFFPSNFAPTVYLGKEKPLRLCAGAFSQARK